MATTRSEDSVFGVSMSPRYSRCLMVTVLQSSPCRLSMRRVARIDGEVHRPVQSERFGRLVRLNGETFRRVLIQRQVRARFVIIAEITFEQSTQMVVIEDDHMVQTFTTNASDQSLHVAVLPRTPWCNANLLDAHSVDSRSEESAIDSITVSNHKPRSAVFRKCLDDLLCSPGRRRVLCHIEVKDAATIVRQNDKDIQHSEPNCRDCKEDRKSTRLNSSH